MSHVTHARRWPKGTWMKLRSAATLRALMEQESLSLAELGRAAGCSKGFISHLLAARRKTCTPVLAQRIAKTLRVPLEVLFDVRESTTGMKNTNQQPISAA